jgi:HD-like signal output (HDOD) protein
MKLDTTHAHSQEAINAINKALKKSPCKIEILYILLTEWADNEDLIEMASFLKDRLTTNEE